MSDTNFNRREMLKAGALAWAAALLNPCQLTAEPRPLQAQGPPVIRLNRNENPYGPGPLARRAIVASAGSGNRYAGDEIGALERMIAGREGLQPENVVLATGSGEILAMAALAYGLDGGEIVAADPTFDWMLRYAALLGAKINRVPLDPDSAHDLSEMSRRVSSRTRLVYVCNPNSPTATVLPTDRLRQFCEDTSKRAVVFADEAYLDYLDDFPAPSMVELVRRGENVIVSRTFSKIYGLAGLRVGYGLARKDIADNLRRLRMSWLNPLSLRAAAASLQDADFVRQTRRRNAEARKFVLAEMDKLKLAHPPSHANFFALKVGPEGRDLTEKVARFGIRIGSATETGWVRVTVGTMDEMRAFVKAMRTILA